MKTLLTFGLGDSGMWMNSGFSSSDSIPADAGSSLDPPLRLMGSSGTSKVCVVWRTVLTGVLVITWKKC